MIMLTMKTKENIAKAVQRTTSRRDFQIVKVFHQSGVLHERRHLKAVFGFDGASRSRPPFRDEAISVFSPAVSMWQWGFVGQAVASAVQVTDVSWTDGG
jgi:hypothetical protein